MLAANPHTIVVLQTSYPDTITWEQQHVPAILWTTHAGAETGHAVADVLFGDVNPAGRRHPDLARSDDQLPADLLDYDIISSEQTYLYSRQKPLYPFGHGLSYTTFRYSPLRTRRVRRHGHRAASTSPTPAPGPVTRSSSSTATSAPRGTRCRSSSCARSSG